MTDACSPTVLELTPRHGPGVGKPGLLNWSGLPALRKPSDAIIRLIYNAYGATAAMATETKVRRDAVWKAGDILCLRKGE